MDKIHKYYILFYLLTAGHLITSAQVGRFKKMKEYQLTFDDKGHTLNHTQCFSPDDKWLVYDTRNEGGLIGSTCCIEKINWENKSIVRVYQTSHQSAFGPGVGAAAYNPVWYKVIFIHGIRNSNAANVYSFTRRTGVMVNDSALLNPVFMDARNIFPPFIPGALRGGTHAHSWSGDGKWLSFTYNDFILEQLEKSGSKAKDLRVIGVMAPAKKVSIVKDGAGENNDGKYFAVVVAKVKEKPEWGSDDIEKLLTRGGLEKMVI